MNISNSESLARILLFLILVIFWAGRFFTINLNFWIWWAIIGFVVNFAYLAKKGHLSGGRSTSDLIIGSLLGIIAWPITFFAIFTKNDN